MLDFECMLKAMKLKQAVGHDEKDSKQQDRFHGPEGKLEEISRDSKGPFVEPFEQIIDPNTGQVTYRKQQKY